MISKDNSATGQLLNLLESRYAIRIVLALKDGHPQTFRLLQDGVTGITPNTLNTRLKDLRTGGLVGHDGRGYVLTELGADLAKHIGDLPLFAAKWAAVLAQDAPYIV